MMVVNNCPKCGAVAETYNAEREGDAPDPGERGKMWSVFCTGWRKRKCYLLVDGCETEDDAVYIWNSIPKVPA